MDLALEVGVSPRHLSFVETGRSRPSPELVLAIATHLDVPLRERNTLLLAAGYAPRYSQSSFDDPSMVHARASLQRMLDAHDPYPGVVVDRQWNVVLANNAAALLTSGLPDDLLESAAERLPGEPASRRPRRRGTSNFAEWAPPLLRQLRRSVVLTGDPQLEALLVEVESLSDGRRVARRVRGHRVGRSTAADPDAPRRSATTSCRCSRRSPRSEHRVTSRSTSSRSSCSSRPMTTPSGCSVASASWSGRPSHDRADRDRPADDAVVRDARDHRHASSLPDAVVLELAWRPELCTSNGILHGGVIMALADSAGAGCAFLNLPDGAAGTSTIESKTNFLGAVRGRVGHRHGPPRCTSGRRRSSSRPRSATTPAGWSPRSPRRRPCSGRVPDHIPAHRAFAIPAFGFAHPPPRMSVMSPDWRSRRAPSSSASATTTPSAASTSRFPAARCTACSARTAPARPPPCASSPRCCGPTRARR